MNGLSGVKAITTSNAYGLGQLFNLPSIGGLYYPQKTGSKVVTMLLNIFKFGIPIYPDAYEESGGNEISEQVLVGGIGSANSAEGSPGDDIAGALVKVADNIVVNPRKWRIHGYTGLNTNTKLGQIMQGLIPEATLQSFVNKFGRDTLNSALKQTLEYIAEARRPFKFNTRDGETIPCLVKSYNIKTTAENGNFVELDIELQEFRFLALTDDGEMDPSGGVTTTFNPAQLGRSALRAIAL